MGRRILITGACGRIGLVLSEHLKAAYDLRLTDIRPMPAADAHSFTQCDITDVAAFRPLCAGVDTVLHLAAIVNHEAGLADLFPVNVLGTENVFRSAAEAGCRRVVFASSLYVVDGYPTDKLIDSKLAPRPLNPYGVSKACGEAMADYYAHQKGLSIICLRVGWAMAPDDPRLMPGSPQLPRIISHADLVRLMTASIEAPEDLRFGIFPGISDNRKKRADLGEARRLLHYRPQDDSFDLARRNILPGLARRGVRRLKKTLRTRRKSG
jgi:uronate dehydrogenase